ncbi:hypothetical protein C8J57DRAFT_1530428 [Mycena rebaudengoi]|nr:hypothetical protein C8J57DRAFT_1530428 [Mycena rebaudengoi]
MPPSFSQTFLVILQRCRSPMFCDLCSAYSATYVVLGSVLGMPCSDFGCTGTVAAYKPPAVDPPGSTCAAMLSAYPTHTHNEGFCQ